MEMSASRKNSLRQLRWILIASALAYVPFSQAEIILLSVSNASAPSFVLGRQGMSSIVMVPPTERGTDSAYLMQRSLAWSTYRRGDKNTGFPLVYVPSGVGMMSATSPRQANVRDHLARANAYRLGYFGK